jgi:HD-GYP domain-containing protein (c-di-GMP phosphodiesterase class II)
MLGLPRKATILWWSVAIGALVVLVASADAAASDVRRLPIAVLMAIACGIAENFKVDLPTSRPGHRMSFSLAGALSVAALLVLPLPWAVLSIAAGMAVGNRTVWFKRLFNTGDLALATAAAGFIWQHSPTPTNASTVEAIPWTVATVIAFFIVNIGLACSMVAFASGMPLLITWWRSNRNTWPPNLGMLFLGVLVAILWSLSAWTIALAAIPLTAVYYALRNTVGLETETIGALFKLADILDARDPYTHGHSLRVGEYAEKLALAMGLSSDAAHLVFLAGRLHDIGKCAIKNEVLLKPGALNDEEREHMCIHPEVGSSMVASFSLFGECAKYVRGHHERWDGAGYPDKLKGDAIPLGARIIAVVDSFDAMTTTRPYRKALPRAEAYQRLAEGAGTQWDPRIIPVFLSLLETTSLAEGEPLELAAQAPLRPAA